MRRWWELLKGLEETEFLDIERYVEFAEWCASLYPRIVRVEEPRGDEVFRAVLTRVDERDGWSLHNLYTIDMLRHGERGWVYRCLAVYLDYVNARPPPNVVGMSPVFEVPLRLFDELLVDMGGGRCLFVPEPARNIFSLSFPAEALEVVFRRLAYRPDVHDEPRISYVLSVRALG